MDARDPRVGGGGEWYVVFMRTRAHTHILTRTGLVVFGHTHAGALKGSHMSVPMLKKMIQQKKLDPNDPRNRHLLELLSSNKEQDGEGLCALTALQTCCDWEAITRMTF